MGAGMGGRVVRAGAAAGAAAVDGTTPLHLAAAAGDEAGLRVLLEAGAAVEAEDEGGARPLHLAAAAVRAEAARLLLDEAGARPEARDGCGRSPLDLASLLRPSSTEIVTPLLARAGRGHAGPGVHPVGRRRELVRRASVGPGQHAAARGHTHVAGSRRMAVACAGPRHVARAHGRAARAAGVRVVGGVAGVHLVCHRMAVLLVRGAIVLGRAIVEGRHARPGSRAQMVRSRAPRGLSLWLLAVALLPRMQRQGVIMAGGVDSRGLVGGSFRRVANVQ